MTLSFDLLGKVEKLLYNLRTQRAPSHFADERNWIFVGSFFPCHVLIVSLPNGDETNASR